MGGIAHDVRMTRREAVWGWQRHRRHNQKAAGLMVFRSKILCCSVEGWRERLLAKPTTRQVLVYIRIFLNQGYERRKNRKPSCTKGLSWHTSTSGNKQKPAFQGCEENPPRGYPTTRRLTRVRSASWKASLKQGPSQATHFP